MSSGQEVGAIFGEGTGPAAALLRSPTVIIASIALWGMNVCLFRLFGIDYVYVLLLDLRKEEEHQKKKKTKKKMKNEEIPHTELSTNDDSVDDFANVNAGTPEKSEVELTGLSMLPSRTDESDEKNFVNVSLFNEVSPSSKEAKAIIASPIQEINEVKLIGLAAILIITLYLTSYLWIQVGRGTTIGAIFTFYGLVAMGILIPFPSTSWIRLACKTVFIRAGALLKPKCSCIHGRPRPVPFVDVFFADGMCSMSKVSSLEHELEAYSHMNSQIKLVSEINSHLNCASLFVLYISLFFSFLLQGIF